MPWWVWGALGLLSLGFLFVKHLSVQPSYAMSRSGQRKRRLFSGGIQIFFNVVLFLFQVMIKLCCIWAFIAASVTKDMCRCVWTLMWNAAVWEHTIIQPVCREAWDIKGGRIRKTQWIMLLGKNCWYENFYIDTEQTFQKCLSQSLRKHDVFFCCLLGGYN